MYVTKTKPQQILSHIYKTLNLKPTLKPFAEEVLSHVGLSFDSFFVRKSGRIKTNIYSYKILDEDKLKSFDSDYKSSCFFPETF